MKTIRLLTLIVFGLFVIGLNAQTIHPQMRNRAYPSNSNGLPIKQIRIVLHNGEHIEVADSTDEHYFDKYLSVYPGATFNINIMSAAMRRLKANPRVDYATYTLYQSTLSSPLTMIVDIYLLAPGQHKDYNGRSGMVESKSMRDYPLIYEDKHAEISLITNAGVGLYNDFDSYFGYGDILTTSDASADDPAGRGSRFWGEAMFEPGVRANFTLKKNRLYAFGAISALFTGRNSSDICSRGYAAYADMEKFYGGLLLLGLGSNKDITVRASFGRQDFQLNDGFLISKWSGSANSGKRTSNYMLARTAFSRVGLLKITTLKWAAEAFYIAPDEGPRHHVDRIAYAGAYVGYNDNRHWNVGVSYIDRVAGNGFYDIGNRPEHLSKKGMYAINPKIWIDNIGATGLFFRSEYVFEGHHDGGMAANAWYVGGGVNLLNHSWMPKIYYRYAFMQGDDGNSRKYTLFDHVLSGGLAEWVQGVTMIKLFGRGNMITHKFMVQLHPSKRVDVVASYHHFRADKLNNPGGPNGLTVLKNKHLGDEITMQTDWNINSHFMLMGIVSWAIPGRGVKEALPKPIKVWSTYELSCFMFF